MIVACCLFRYFPFGGLSRDFRRIVEELVSQGHEVRIYVDRWMGKKIDCVKIIEFRSKSFTNDGLIRNYIRKLKSELSRSATDVVLGFNKMPGLDFYFVADVCFVDKVEREKEGLLKSLYKITPRYRTLKVCETAVFGSESQTRIMFLDKSQLVMFNDYYDLNKKIKILLPPGISNTCRRENYADKARLEFRKKYHLSNSDKIIVQVGSDFSRKGLDRTLIAFADVQSKINDSLYLIIVGKDDIKPYSRLIDRLGIAERILFLGGVDSAELCIASSDILIHPAYVENTGTIILEALALNIPTVVTENCGFSWYTEESKSGIVVPVPYKQEFLNKALYRLLKEKEFFNKCKLNAKNYCANKDFYRMPKEVVQYLEDFVNEKKRLI